MGMGMEDPLNSVANFIHIGSGSNGLNEML